ncbi:hypothetical protein [Mesorhizobium sp. CN2-181]|uniref:hypothetical protein n=1 Tax=Mesorhizobium yinganensis TaxID=3157707 RepID=UPI0032B7E263
MTMIASGDYIRSSSGNIWIVQFAVDEPILKGQHLMLARRVITKDGVDEILHCFRDENELYTGWLGSTEFNLGDRFDFEGEDATLHSMKGIAASLRLPDSTFEPVWLWQLAMMDHALQQGSPVSFLCASQRWAKEAEI